MRWVSSSFLLLVAAGCPGINEIEVEIPADITAVGLIKVDAQNRLVKASSLAPWGPSLSVFTRSDERQIIVGYTDEQLALYPGIVSSAQPLKEARGCTNRLPVPAFAAFVDRGGLSKLDPQDAPVVTTIDVEETCPSLTDQNWAVDLTCFDERCVPRLESVRGCTLHLGLEACGGGMLSVTFDAQGKGCAELQGRSEQCRPIEDPYSDASITCSASDTAVPCGVHVYQDARNREPPFSIVRNKWTPGDRKEPPFLSSRAWIGARYLRSGYAHAMTNLASTVVISGPQDPDLGCSNQGSIFYFIDPETLEAERSIPTLGCADAISADPDGQTFVSAFIEGDTWYVGRFNAEGIELQRTMVTESQLRGVNDVVPIWRPDGILRSADGVELWLVMYDDRGDQRLPGAAVVRFDARTLTLVATEMLPRWHRSFSGVVLGPSEFALVAEWSFTVGWFAKGDPSPSTRVEVTAPDDVKNILYGLLPLDADRLLLAARGRAPAAVVHRRGFIERAVHPGGENEAGQVMMHFVDWDGPIKLGLGQQTLNEGRHEVIATLLDTDNDRFVPGVWVLGDGMPGAVTMDRQGRHFVLLPWTAELVRIDRLSQ